MKYYFSDSSFDQETEDFVYAHAKNRLISYHYKSGITKYIKLYRKYNESILDISEYSLLIDSGAYSIWNSGKPPIDPKEYGDFCLKLLDDVSDLNFKTIEFINLDVIPGVKGDPLTRIQLEEAEEKSLENFIYLNDRIPKMMPVFHQGDDFKYIKEFEKYTLRYCVAPRQDQSISKRLLWIQDVFRIAEIDFKPHGLGFSNSTIARANPWYSFDASTHALRAGYGVIMYSNEEGMMDIVFSEVRTSEDTGTHFGNLTKIAQKELLDEFLKINPVFTLENILNSSKYRKMLNMYYVNKFYLNLKPPINLVQESLFM